MNKTNWFIIGTLALALAGCRDDASRAIENSEKEALDERAEVDKEQGDVVEAQDKLAEEKAELRDEVAEAADARAEFMTRYQRRKAAVDRKIAIIEHAYRTHRATLDADDRDDIRDRMDKIDTQRREVDNAFKVASVGDKDRWDDLEHNASEALADLEKTVTDLADSLDGHGIQVDADLDVIDHGDDGEPIEVHKHGKRADPDWFDRLFGKKRDRD